MKRCPKCGREYDLTMSYCLDDGSELLYGPATNEPATAILSEPPALAGGQFHDEPATALFSDAAEAKPQESLVSPSERQSLSARRAAKPLIAVAVAAVLLIGGFFGYRYLKPAETGQINSIAVLPFENKSSDADSEYLSDGLAESLIYRLSQLPNLKVSPTSSVFRYKGKETDPQVVAKELGVESVMTGRITERGDNLTISVNLVDTRNGKSLWGEQYERKMSELLATQREIATKITEKLQLKLAGNEKGITKKYTDSNEAYQLYLKGRFHFAKRTKEDILKSIEFFQQAIELDQNFALVHSAVAESYNVMPSHGYLSPGEATTPARAAVKKALAIDSSLAEAHTQLGSIHSNYDWLWAEAENEYKRALEIDPNNSSPHLRYGQHLWAVGRLDEAIAELSKSLELEPLSLTSSANLCLVTLYAGQATKALELARKTYDLEPNFVTGRLALGAAYNGNGMYDDAIRLTENMLENHPNNHWMLWMSGYAYARSGRRQEAEEIIKRFREMAKTQYVISYYNASIYAALSEKDKAFAELEKSFEQRDWWLPRMKYDPLMGTLRDDPRFAGLLKRMNLPE